MFLCRLLRSIPQAAFSAKTIQGLYGYPSQFHRDSKPTDCKTMELVIYTLKSLDDLERPHPLSSYLYVSFSLKCCQPRRISRTWSNCFALSMRFCMCARMSGTPGTWTLASQQQHQEHMYPIVTDKMGQVSRPASMASQMCASPVITVFAMLQMPQMLQMLHIATLTQLVLYPFLLVCLESWPSPSLQLCHQASRIHRRDPRCP